MKTTEQCLKNVEFAQNYSKSLQNQKTIRFISRHQKSPKTPGSLHDTLNALKTFNLYCKWGFASFQSFLGPFGDSWEGFKNVKSLIPLFFGTPCTTTTTTTGGVRGGLNRIKHDFWKTWHTDRHTDCFPLWHRQVSALYI